MDFIRLRRAPFIPSLLSVFVKKGRWILVKRFFCINTEDHVYFCSLFSQSSILHGLVSHSPSHGFISRTFKPLFTDLCYRWSGSMCPCLPVGLGNMFSALFSFVSPIQKQSVSVMILHYREQRLLPICRKMDSSCSE